MYYTFTCEHTHTHGDGERDGAETGDEEANTASGKGPEYHCEAMRGLTSEAFHTFLTSSFMLLAFMAFCANSVI